MPKSLNCASSPGKKLPFLTRKICEEMFGVASYPSLPAHFFTMEDTSWGRPAQIIFGGEGKHTHTQVFQTRWSSLNLTLKHLLHFIHLFVLPPVNVSSSSHAHRCTHLVFYRTSAAFFCSCAAQAVDYAFSFVLALHKQLIMHFFVLALHKQLIMHLYTPFRGGYLSKSQNMLISALKGQLLTH